MFPASPCFPRDWSMSASPFNINPVATPGPTGRVPWSTMLLREWALRRYPGFALQEQFKLGPTPITLAGVVVSPPFAQMLTVANWKIDGVLVTDSEVLFIEAKMVADPRAVGQIDFYMSLAGSTPSLIANYGKVWQPVVLWAEDIAKVSAWARLKGVRVEVYTPSWIETYMERVQFRNRSSVPLPATLEPGKSPEAVNP